MTCAHFRKTSGASELEISRSVSSDLKDILQILLTYSRSVFLHFNSANSFPFVNSGEIALFLFLFELTCARCLALSREPSDSGADEDFPAAAQPSVGSSFRCVQVRQFRFLQLEKGQIVTRSTDRSHRRERTRERGDMDLHFFQGQSLLDSRDFVGAERALRLAVTLDPQCVEEPPDSRHYLGIALRKLGRLEEALEILDEGIEYLPRQDEHAQVCCEAAEVAVELGLLDRARDYYVRTLRHQARSARLQFGLIRLSTTAVAMPRPANFQGPLFNEIVQFAEGKGKCRMRSFQRLDGSGEILVVSMNEDRKGPASASNRLESAVRGFRERRPGFARPLGVVLLEANPFQLDVTSADLGPEGDRAAHFGPIDFEDVERSTGFRFLWTADHFGPTEED